MPPPSADLDASASLQLAINMQSGGRLAEAEKLFKAVLAADESNIPSMQNLAMLCARQGRLTEAGTYLRMVIGQNPQIIAAHNNLGNVMSMLGRPDEAAASYETALAINPNYPEGHNNLGIALAAMNRHNEAIAHYRKAIELNPQFANAYNNLGNVLTALNQYADAVSCYQRALALIPRYSEANNNLGVALVRSGRAEDAITHYRTALQINPNYADAYSNLGAALESLGRAEEALPLIAKAISLQPDNADAQNNMGNALKALNRHTEALEAYQKAIDLRPDSPQTFSNMGDALRELGDAAGARTSYEQAVKLDPNQPSFYRRLGDTLRFKDTDPRLAAMRGLLQNVEALTAREQVELHFALAKAMDDIGDKPQSFRHLLEGNALHRRQINYDEAETLGFFSRIEQVFTAELMSSERGFGDPTQVPVFVVGMIRSGTTLVEQILASHPAVHGGGERMEFARATANMRNPQIPDLTFPEVCLSATGDQLTELGTGYLRSLQTLSPEALRIVDKMPANYRLLGLINLALPNARILHLRRDPLDTCVSCFSILFAGDQPFTYDLTELGRYYRSYESLMEHWRRVLPEGVMLDLDYEDLVADIEGHAQRIVEHVGLPWHDSCTRFFENRRAVRTASTLQVRKPAYNDSVGRWRPYGDLLNPLLDALNSRG
jgi:tetratricopeptide (TPR) repeat protein